MQQQLVNGVNRILAISSAKGGVGKTTTAMMCALYYAKQGRRVGLLDADIYGPNIPLLLGVDEKPTVSATKQFTPVMADGIQLMSMGLLVSEQTPMVWRGPMVSQALKQLLFDTLWDAVDVLIVDLPPGTGDIALTFSQKVKADASIVVTTAHPMARQDALRGIRMFEKVTVPVLGVIENMSYVPCGECGHQTALYGELNGQQWAKEHNTTFLTSIPFDPKLATNVVTECGIYLPKFAFLDQVLAV